MGRLSKHLPDSLASKIFMAVGEASMCWEHVEKAGIFDSNEASRVARDLCEVIAEELRKNNIKLSEDIIT